MLHPFGVFKFGTLATCGPDSGTAAAIQNFSLQGCQIGIETHFASECIEFVNEVTFRKSAD